MNRKLAHCKAGKLPITSEFLTNKEEGLKSVFIWKCSHCPTKEMNIT